MYDIVTVMDAPILPYLSLQTLSFSGNDWRMNVELYYVTFRGTAYTVLPLQILKMYL